MIRSLKLIWILLTVSSSLYSTDYFMVFLVNARGLNYTSTGAFIRTVAKHPSDGSKNGDVGHAWIYLNGETVIEGGHSGELGIDQPRYLEGVLENCEYGAKNPISYLWCPQADGFFQTGNGGHTPTCAVRVDITQAQYQAIYHFIAHYDFSTYSITGNQCSSFVKQVASLLDLDLADEISLLIPQWMYLEGEYKQMWADPKYQTLTFSSPDILQKSLKQIVKEGKGKNALSWYLRTHRKCLFCKFRSFWENMARFPERSIRYYQLKQKPRY